MKKIFSLSMGLTFLVILTLSMATSMYFVGEINADFIVGGFGVAFLLALTPKQVALFETIPIDQVRAAQTNAMVALYNERPVVKSFLRSFFPTETSTSKFISIEVQKGNEKIAVDVVRGAGSNLNQVTKSTVKTFLPPYFNEEYFVNELEIYDVAYGTMNPAQMRNLAVDQANAIGKIIDKIDRSYEKQCADVLQTGIVSLKSGDNIDFRREADSLIDNSGEYWNNNSNDPDVSFERAGKFLRERGKLQSGPGSRYMCLLGGKAFQDLINNSIFKSKHDLKDINLGGIIPAEFNTDGASYHGYISVGSYIYDLWTYPEVYNHPDTGVLTPYVDLTNMIVTNYNPNFKFVYGMVPQLPGLVVPMTVKEGFYTLEYVDTKQMCHGQKIMSAGVAVPVAVNQIYTEKVTATV
jgi:Phage major capsid protein E